MSDERVGPVFGAGPVAEAMIEAIRGLNRGVEVVDRGGYFRVSAPGCCTLTRRAAEERLGRPLTFPGDLEKVLCSYVGDLELGENEAVWKAHAR